MDSQGKVELIQLLIYILIPVVIAIIALGIFLFYLYVKDKKSKETKKEGVQDQKINASTQDRQSIFNFMEFDTVKDNMIVQQNGQRYLMVIECQGINYDLMSGVEKTSVEEGFVQFLNALRHKIQIYVQTRSINLESSLDVYRERVKEIENKLNNMKMQYEEMVESNRYNEQQLAKAFFEITKQSNLYEYGLSVLQDTERMSLNRNILSKKYYIIVPYLAAEAENDKLGKSEIENIAFSELYTRSQSLIRAISTCGVRGKILRSDELIDLLYMSYNRDEAETFGLEKALKAGYDEMYSTAPDVLKKKMKELDKEIETKAIERAKEKINEVKSELQQQIFEKEESEEELIAEMAKLILKRNQRYVDKEVIDKAIDKIENERKGGNEDGKKTTRGRKRTTTV